MSHKWMIDVLSDLQVVAQQDGKEKAARFLGRAKQELLGDGQRQDYSADLNYEQRTPNGNDYRDAGSGSLV